MLKRIKRWYKGEQKIHENDPNSPISRIGVYTKRHWTANITHILINFYLEHWKWIWSSIFTIIAIAITL